MIAFNIDPAVVIQWVLGAYVSGFAVGIAGRVAVMAASRFL